MKVEGKEFIRVREILSSLLRISNLMASPMPPEEVLNGILESIINGLKYDRVALYLLSEDGEILEGVMNIGCKMSIKNIKYKVSEDDCVETKVVKTGKVYFIKDGLHDTLLTELDRKRNLALQRTCCVHVPVLARQKVIGTIAADRSFSKTDITPEDIELLQMFANQAGLVIEMNRLLETVKRERNFVKTILQSSPNAIVAVDMQGNIILGNKSWEEFFCSDNRNYLGERFLKYFEYNPELSKKFDEVIYDSQIVNYYEARVNLPTRGETYLSISMAPMKGRDEKPTGAIIIIHDMTEKIKMDEQLRRMSHLAALGHLAAGIAHEIRNPLTGISVSLEIIRDEIPVEGECLKLLERISDEIIRLEGIVNSLLDFARPSMPERKLVDINRIIEEFCEIFEERIKKEGQILVIKKSDDTEKVYVDDDRIKQVLFNLCINAMEAGKPGSKVEITSYKKGDFIAVEIRDSGKGIPAHIRDQIFNPFFTTKQRGTGLGLSIAHSIIKEHDGWIDVESEEGKGSVFTIYLPVYKEAGV